MALNKLIGNSFQISLEHRIMNIVLLMGLVTAVSCAGFSWWTHNNTVALMCIVITAIFAMLYYVSTTKKLCSIILFLLVCLIVFVCIPAVWYTGGISGSSMFFLFLFFTIFAVLLRGSQRMAAISCLFSMTSILLLFDSSPVSTTAYSGAGNALTGISHGLLGVMMLNAFLYAAVLILYMKEHEKSAGLPAQHERQKPDLDFRQEISRLDRMNIVGAMAASVGHEIRNPLTTVRGFLQLFLNKSECSPHCENIHLMISELDRANSIITEFLSLTKDKPIDRQPEDLGKLVEDVYPLLQATAIRESKNVVLALHSRPIILADKGEIKQCVLNLTKNALEAVDKGGKVIIAVYEEGSAAILSVQDNGKGIPSETYTKLGTPFFTTKEQGTGLGLSVCYSIAKHHEANIDIKTGPAGTTFLCKFPLAPAG